MTNRVHASCATAALAIAVSGCFMGGDQRPPSDWESFEQKLELDVEGGSIPVPLEAMDVWLTEDDDWPETFEIRSEGVSLGGTFPRDVRIGYEDDFTVLIGRAITIDPRHSTPYEDKTSIVTVPGVGPVQVLGGRFTIERVDEGWDAKTPISGTIELRLRTGAGEVTMRGRLAVKGTGWG